MAHEGHFLFIEVPKQIDEKGGIEFKYHHLAAS